MNTREDTYVSAGKELMALVDANSFWKAGYFKETQLPHIHVDQKTLIKASGRFPRCDLALQRARTTTSEAAPQTGEV
jgi:multidrug resistance efflux pump